jgi:hypothetical protein
MGERFSDNVSEATELFDYLLLKQEPSSREALPNVPAHRERPDRALSDFAESQRGRDAVARLVSPPVTQLLRACLHTQASHSTSSESGPRNETLGK